MLDVIQHKVAKDCMERKDTRMMKRKRIECLLVLDNKLENPNIKERKVMLII